MKQLSRVEQQAECAACPWNRRCIQPPTMTEEEVRAQVGLDEQPDPKSKDDVEKSMFEIMMKTLVYAGRDAEAPVCPIFANALRSGPELSQKIRDIMQGKD